MNLPVQIYTEFKKNKFSLFRMFLSQYRGTITLISLLSSCYIFVFIKNLRWSWSVVTFQNDVLCVLHYNTYCACLDIYYLTLNTIFHIFSWTYRTDNRSRSFCSVLVSQKFDKKLIPDVVASLMQTFCIVFKYMFSVLFRIRIFTPTH